MAIFFIFFDLRQPQVGVWPTMDTSLLSQVGAWSPCGCRKSKKLKKKDFKKSHGILS